MEKEARNPRRDFLKLIPLTAVSLGAFSFFTFKKSAKYSEKNYNTLSKSEADDIIRNAKFPVSTRIKPAPAPDVKMKQQG